MRGIFLAIGASIVAASCGIGPQAVSNLGVDSNLAESLPQVVSNQSADDLWLLDGVKSSYSEAIWFLPCDGTDRAPAAAPGQLVISGRSVNSVRENFMGTKIIFQGRVCPPKNLPRDVVFMIDVSASMGYADGDPLVGGTCKRLTQLESMIALLPAGSNFGVVAYEETITAASKNLFTTKAAMYADLTKNGSVPIANIVCGWRNQGFLDVGMASAKTLLSMGRGTDVQKELVIITDGDNTVMPSNTHLMNGIQAATDLRNVGVVVGGAAPVKVQIAGLRVASGQVDKYLRLTASTDLTGITMVDDILQSSRMNTRLDSLSLGILNVANLNYGPSGSVNGITMNIKSNLAADFTFRIMAGTLALTRDQTGYDVRLDSADMRGNANSVTGRLNWVLP